MKSYQYSDWGIHIVLCADVLDWSGVDREFIFRELFKFNRGGGQLGLHAGTFYGDSLVQGYTHALALINQCWVFKYCKVKINKT